MLRLSFNWKRLGIIADSRLVVSGVLILIICNKVVHTIYILQEPIRAISQPAVCLLKYNRLNSVDSLTNFLSPMI